MSELPAHREAQLDEAVSSVEQGLAALGEALRARDAAAIERSADALHRALALAVERIGAFSARGDRIPPPLRERLAVAGGHVAAQRESLARATAALDRAIDVLLPAQPAHGLYGAQGAAARGRGGGLISA